MHTFCYGFVIPISWFYDPASYQNKILRTVGSSKQPNNARIVTKSKLTNKCFENWFKTVI